MKRAKAIELNNALASKDLKVKHLSGQSYVSLIGLKRSSAQYLMEMGEQERELTKDYSVTLDDKGNFVCSDKTFFEKLTAIQSKEFEPKEMNFIPFDEFKRFTDEADFNTGSILSEYLLKP